MLLVSQLTRSQAKDIDRVRLKLNLSYGEIARRAKVSSGTVWNFLDGRSVRCDYAERICRQLQNAVEQPAQRRRLTDEELTFIRTTLSTIRLVIESRTTKRIRKVEGFKSSAMVSSHLTGVIMALTDEPRLNLTKSFDYFDPDHFHSHVCCVASEKVSYSWLAYETSDLYEQWRELYIEPLVEQLIDELGWSEENIRKLVAKQVSCRVFPNTAQRSGQLIPFRIVIFGNVACLCTEEPKPRTYPYGQTILLRDREFPEVRKQLSRLYDECPSIETLGTKEFEVYASKKCNVLMNLHTELRTVLLHALLLSDSLACRPEL